MSVAGSESSVRSSASTMSLQRKRQIILDEEKSRHRQIARVNQQMTLPMEKRDDYLPGQAPDLSVYEKQSLGVPDKSADMLKKSNGLRGGWKKRWFVLKGNILYYYKSRRVQMLYGIVLLENCFVRKVISNSNSSHVDTDFEIFSDQAMAHKNKAFVIRCDSEEQCRDWVDTIRSAIVTEGDGASLSRVFGIHLPLVIQHQPGDQTVPFIVARCATYLTSTGMGSNLFVTPGNHQKVLALRTAFDEGSNVDFVATRADPFVVATLLQQYLKELPQPIFTYILYENFVLLRPTTPRFLETFRAALLLLPKPNYDLSVYLFRFFHSLVSNSSSNRLTDAALGEIFHAVFIRTKDDHHKAFTAVSQTIIATYITNFPDIIQDPSGIGSRHADVLTREVIRTNPIPSEPIRDNYQPAQPAPTPYRTPITIPPLQTSALPQQQYQQNGGNRSPVRRPVTSGDNNYGNNNSNNNNNSNYNNNGNNNYNNYENNSQRVPGNRLFVSSYHDDDMETSMAPGSTADRVGDLRSMMPSNNNSNDNGTPMENDSAGVAQVGLVAQLRAQKEQSIETDRQRRLKEMMDQKEKERLQRQNQSKDRQQMQMQAQQEMERMREDNERMKLRLKQISGRVERAKDEDE